MELTHEEESILSGISFNGEQIKNGELDENDKALLTEMRAVGAYLKKKYPSYEFVITGCELKAGTAKDYNEWYYRAEGIERDSAFIATSREMDGKLEIKDDFYGEVVRKAIQEEIEDDLTQIGLPVIQINIGFWEYLGKEYGEKISAGEVLQGIIPAGNDIKIFLDGSKLSGTPYEEVVVKIKELMIRKKVVGDIYIVVLKDADSDFARDRLYSKSVTLD